MLVSTASIIIWLSLSCLLTYVVIAFYTNLRLNYYDIYYDYSDRSKYSGVRKANPPPNFSWTESHLIWIALIETILHITYWSFVYHVRDTLPLYTFELQIIYCLLTFIPLLQSLQFNFSFLDQSETVGRKRSLIFSGLLILYLTACAVINAEYISNGKESFRIPALILNASLLIMALSITIIACRNAYNTYMTFRKYKKYFENRLQEVEFHQEQQETMQALFWVVKTVFIFKPLITVGLTAGTILYSGIIDTAQWNRELIDYFWSSGIQNIQIPFYCFSACLAPTIMMILKYYNGEELYVFRFQKEDLNPSEEEYKKILAKRNY